MRVLVPLLFVAALAVPQSAGAQGGTAQARRAAAVEPPIMLPVPPIPPDAPSLLEAAPTPNSIAAPVAAQAPRGAELTPTLMGPKQVYQGDGFLTGSTVQSEQQRRAKPAAGFNLTVPLR